MKNKIKLPYKIAFFLSIIYLVGLGVFAIWHRIGLSPDQFFPAAFVLTVILGRVKQFIRDWSIPTIIFLGYEYVRGLIPQINTAVHAHLMIDFDQLLFKTLPTINLQHEFYNATSLHWYDYASTILYMSHFIIPFTIGFLFWLRNRELFKKYSQTLILVSYMAFITYIAFPAVPPWLAANTGIIPPVTKIVDVVFKSFPTPLDLPSIYRFFGVNQIAAVPSIHAAYPWIIFLYLYKRFKKKALLALPYVFGVWFAVVYLGEHYVFDVVLGVIYSTAAFMLINNFGLLKTRAAKLFLKRPLTTPTLSLEEA